MEANGLCVLRKALLTVTGRISLVLIEITKLMIELFIQLLGLIADEFGVGDEICGAVLSLRSSEGMNTTMSIIQSILIYRYHLRMEPLCGYTEDEFANKRRLEAYSQLTHRNGDGVQSS